ncbi:TetR family transcriptional regulator C-terminal domain-containing protein [Bacillus cereus]|uniref:TetR family transcriptional regulator n=1 Tax=Bacillus cereus TaxID=1396 RepID=A0A2A8ZQX0_BACCE|nr:TetR family transcriptional regulator C-terminal domain-containing protein [Bacillus cereus]PFE07737.1 TetR family transcriptional regulator [Bacillus cereus]
MNKRRYDSESTKNEIMERASFLFSQKGYNQTSIRDISKASGYSKGHIYYHFKNKEQLFVLLAQKSMQDWYKKWEAKESVLSTATEKLYGIGIHVLYNYQAPLLKSGQELASNPKSSPESVKKLYDLAVVPMSTYRTILQKGVDNEEFKTGNLDEWTVLLGTWLGGLCQLTNTQELNVLEPMFNQAITIFLRSIKKGGNENEDWINR